MGLILVKYIKKNKFNKLNSRKKNQQTSYVIMSKQLKFNIKKKYLH